MKKICSVTAGVALCATSAYAGGMERSAQSVAILFEPGNYAEFTLGSFNPSVSGVTGGIIPGLPAGLPSGDMTGSYVTFSLGYKRALNDDVDIAVIVDQPIGADVDYSAAFAPYPFAGSQANVESLAVTGLLRYKLPSNFSVYGGLRAQKVEGELGIVAPLGFFVPGAPGILDYNLKGDADYGFGYVVGVAWEKPEIAARVALTYNSKIDHTLDTAETGVPFTIGAIPGELNVEIPQSVNLEFQTGIAADTLLFGSVRWVEWTAFDITPEQLGIPIVFYRNNIVTYNLGVGRKFSDHWSGAVTFGYEKTHGDLVGNLGPTDGYKSIGLAATYTMDNVKITGGLRYVDIGDATTGIGSDFSDNDGIGAGIRIGYSF